MEVIGKVHSIQSMGALDGPGLRFVVFLKGCNLRCGCCHNPDTFDYTDAKEYTPKQILNMAVRYKEYFKDNGGITISGGEPLLQSDFVGQVFALCKEAGINTCLDTSGSLLNDNVREMLKFCDRVLLDIKYTTDEDYLKYVGCSLNDPIKFLEYLNSKGIAVTLRQVIIPTLNDNDQNILALKKIANDYSVVDSIELLPFKKICQVKYDSLGMEFPFANMPEPKAEDIARLEQVLRD